MKEAKYTSEDVQRFLAKVDKSGQCWIWTAATFSDGYGAFQLSNPVRTVRAHRFSFVVYKTEFESDLQVLHHCDNPLCVRPDHLFLGTVVDNMKDRDSKRRQTHGTKQWQAKLNATSVREIRRLYADGVSIAKLARKFKMGETPIRNVCFRHSWKHVS